MNIKMEITVLKNRIKELEEYITYHEKENWPELNDYYWNME